MRAYEAVAAILIGGLLATSAVSAQVSNEPVQPQQGATAPATTGQTAAGQNAAASGEMQSQELSPEAQAALAKKVIHAILMLPYYGVFDSIAFRLQGRTVILQGEVLRSILKPDAEKAVKKIEGVEKVVNNIEVLPPGPLDMRIREQVRQAIYGYGPFLKYANQPNPPIRIIVKNARLTLEGVVDTEVDKGQATMRANQVSDVLSVTNNLRVVKP
jgi:hyperosmotically inducible protein